MKWICFLLLVPILAPSCSIREREKELDRKISEINQREQELVLREKSIGIKEEELARRQQQIDSIFARTPATDSLSTDSSVAIDPAVAGTWSVRMTCVETTCAGSAIGDTRNERWEISIQDGSVIARAMSGNKLIRSYSGGMRGEALNLTTQQDANGTDPSVRMIVRLQSIRANEMEGRREIIRGDDCRILYRMDMKKQ